MPGPERDVILRQQLAEAQVIEYDENIHSRHQKQLDLLAKDLMYLLREVRDLQGG